MKQISFIIPSFNTNTYAEWCYNSIRKNLTPDHEIVFIDDGSKDNSDKLIKEIANKDNNVKYHINETNIGIAYSYNKAVELASNEIICLIHTDIYIPPNFDKVMLSELTKHDFITCLRVEPPVYPKSSDKFVFDFGLDLNTFKENEYLDYNSKLPTIFSSGTGQLRTCFPWMTTKKVFNSVGGIDTLFLKYMVDDDDFYFRIAKSDYSYWQTFNTSVYHLCSRSTKFENDNTTSQGSDKWKKQYLKSTKNFIRKWGFHQQFVYNQDSSINKLLNKYNVGLKIDNLYFELLIQLEPFFDTIYSDFDYTNYINNEQPNTLIDLKSKLKPISEYTNDLILEFDAKEIDNEHFNMLLKIRELIPRLKSNQTANAGKIKIITHELKQYNINVNERKFVTI